MVSWIQSMTTLALLWSRHASFYWSIPSSITNIAMVYSNLWENTLSIDGAVNALASIATTRAVFNVRVYVSSVAGYSSYWPTNDPPLQFEMGPREQLGTFSTDPSSTTA